MTLAGCWLSIQLTRTILDDVSRMTPPCAGSCFLGCAINAEVNADFGIEPTTYRSFGGGTSRRRDWHLTDTPCLSLLKHLIHLQGGVIK